jgi:mRNA interferase MazF
MTMSSPIYRGEVWLVNLSPTVGVEMQKQRPVVVLSVNGIGKLPIKLVVPITSWKEAFKNNFWHVQLHPSSANGLSKVSAADVLQVRGLDVARFIGKLGTLEDAKLEELMKAVVGVIGYGGR